MALDSVTTVRRMLAAWSALDTEAILATMTHDVRYHNVPLPVLEGKDAVGRWIGKFLGTIRSFDVDYLAETESAEGIVFNERVDVIGYPDGRSVPIRIAGVFRLRDGLIADWRDYFDLAEFQGGQGATPGGRQEHGR